MARAGFGDTGQQHSQEVRLHLDRTAQGEELQLSGKHVAERGREQRLVVAEDL